MMMSIVLLDVVLEGDDVVLVGKGLPWWFRV